VAFFTPLFSSDFYIFSVAVLSREGNIHSIQTPLIFRAFTHLEKMAIVQAPKLK